jgi:hypothetical protein
MKTKNDLQEDLERDRLRDEAIIVYEKREEVDAAWREYEESVSRKPAKIVVEISHEVQADTLPF